MCTWLTIKYLNNKIFIIAKFLFVCLVFRTYQQFSSLIFLFLREIFWNSYILSCFYSLLFPKKDQSRLLHPVPFSFSSWSWGWTTPVAYTDFYFFLIPRFLNVSLIGKCFKLNLHFTTDNNNESSFKLSQFRSSIRITFL